VELSCNFIWLRYNHKNKVCEYHVSFEPELDSIKYRRIALNQFNEELGTVRNFDGSMLFLPILLSEPVSLLDCNLSLVVIH
jgi:hypothetical protein